MKPTASSSLADWLAWLEAQHPRGSAGIELGLERVREIKQRLGQRETCPVFLVAGTNGKGSVCAMLECILLNAGYRVGLYTSPHLLDYNERVRLCGRNADDAQLIAGFERVEQVRGDVALTYFEFGTLAAWEVFAAASLDVIILEVGLGGRLDATNVYEPSCSVVTTIDLDHMSFLGPDRESIGREKAGVFRQGIPAICGDPQPPTSLTEHAADLGARLQIIGRDYGFMPQEQQWLFWLKHADGTVAKRGGLAYPGLRGAQQLINAATVMVALDALKDALPVAMKDIRQGLIKIELAGRFQVLPGRPTIILDVAHNPQAARILAGNLSDMAFHPKTWAVFGMMADKDIGGVIDALKERVTDWLPCTVDGPRAASGAHLAECLGARGLVAAKTFKSAEEALIFAREQANENDRILVFGSFLTVAAALKHLGRTV